MFRERGDGGEACATPARWQDLPWHWNALFDIAVGLRLYDKMRGIPVFQWSRVEAPPTRETSTE